MALFPALFLSLALSFLLSEALKRVGIPRVVGQISAGLILSISVLKELVFDAETLSAFNGLADVGIVLMFFFIGLGINLRVFSRNVKEGVLISVFNTLLPFALGVGIAILLGQGLLGGVVLGIAFAVSSQTVTMDLLEESKMIKSRIGSLIIGAGAIDDIIEFVLIGVLLTSLQLQESATPASIIIGLLAFVGILTIFRLFILEWLLKVFEKQRSERALFMGALIIALLMASLSGYFGISGLIGALIAGALVRQVLLKSEHYRPWEEQHLSKNLDIVSFGFFIPLFFVSVGLNVDVTDMSGIVLGVALGLVSLVATVAATALGVVLCGKSLKEGILIGIGVTPKGDVDVVVSTLALGAGLISRDLFSAIVVMAMVTSLVGPVLFRMAARRWAAEINSEKSPARSPK